jgi:hypothetical protein
MDVTFTKQTKGLYYKKAEWGFKSAPEKNTNLTPKKVLNHTRMVVVGDLFLLE